MSDARLLFLIIALAIFGLRLFLRYGSSSARNQPMPDPDDPRWEHNRGREPPPKKKKKKKKKKSEASSSGDESMEALVKAMQNDKQPRPRHYAFAHGKLRLLLRTGSAVWPMFRDAKSEAELNLLIDKAWDGDDADAADAGEYPWRPTARTIDGGILVRMPPPEGTTEAHFIAVLEHEGKVRYFTLEKSLMGAVLCEWTDAVHANMGSCPTDEESFLAAVRNKLTPAN